MEHVLLLDDLDAKAASSFTLDTAMRKRYELFAGGGNYLDMSREFWSKSGRLIKGLQCNSHRICCAKPELFNSVFYDRYVLRKPMTMICEERGIDKSNISQVRIELKEQIDLAVLTSLQLDPPVLTHIWQYVKLHCPSIEKVPWRSRAVRSNIARLQFITWSRHKSIHDRYDVSEDNVFFIY